MLGENVKLIKRRKCWQRNSFRRRTCD